jgi:E3 ubiquitin-protein ligase mind-bomb
MDRGANPDEEDKDGDLAIHYATLGDEPKVIELLVSYGVDLNTRNLRQQTPLHIAVNKGYITIIQVLLNHHCHPSLQDTGGDTPLHDAIGKKRDDITELLLEGGADITVTNKNGFNCLHHASLRGNLGAVRLIMQYMTPLCNINTPKDDGFTSLHLATLNNHIEVAKVLIQNGANVDSVTENNQTPLHLAVERQNGQIVRLLVEENANVNIPDRYGDTPLHCALRQHTLMQLKELKESPQDVSKVLSSSQKKASSSVSIFLASHGADFTLLNSSKQSPLDLCSESNLIKILQKCREEYQMKQNGINEKEELDKCIMCKSNQRDMLNIPCGHIMLCSSCSSNVSNCNHCDISIQDKIKV